MTTLQTVITTALALLATLGLIRLWTRHEPAEDHPTLSPDLLPRPRLRHWWAARGSGYVAWWLCQLEARDRRRLGLRLSGHGTLSVDSGEDRGQRTGRVERDRNEDVLRFPKRRAS